MKRLWILLLALMLSACAAHAEEDDYLFGAPEQTPAPTAQAPEAQAQPAENHGNQLESTPDPGQAVYLILSAAGDVTLGRDTRKSADIFSDELKKQGGDLSFPFRNVQEYFASDDLTIVNFEGTLTNTKSATDNTFSFASPPEHVQALLLGNIEAVAFENNHATDHGQQGITDTQQTLRDAGVVFSGFGEMGYFEAQGLRVGMLSFQTFNGAYDTIYRDMPGMIGALRAERCDLVIVSYHWGEERVYTPNERQQGLGRATIDAGADLVLGHHAHILKPIEIYKGKAIFYSLGNFAMEEVTDMLRDQATLKQDMLTSKNHTEMTAISEGFRTTKRSFPMDCYYTMVAKWTVKDGRIIRVSYLPAYLPEDGAPYLVGPEDPKFGEINAYMEKITAKEKLGTAYRVCGDEVIVIDSTGTTA